MFVFVPIHFLTSRTLTCNLNGGNEEMEGPIEIQMYIFCE